MPKDRTIPRNRTPVPRSDTEKMVHAFFALETLYADYDKGRANLERSTEHPICIEHCGRCCERMTPVASRLEAMYALANMSSLPTYHDLRERAEQWLSDQHVPLKDEPSSIAEDFKALSHGPCPFLDGRDKSCMIYPFRPLACRSYGVVRSADPWCPRPLHWSEKEDNRMVIGRDTPLGRRVADLIKGISSFVKAWKPEFSQVGLFPAFIAKELVSEKSLSEMGHIPPAKMAYRESSVSPFYIDDLKKRLTMAMERTGGDKEEVDALAN